MEAIVLAAGYSSRANAFKMTLPTGANDRVGANDI